jgi:hypothetical protein
MYWISSLRLRCRLSSPDFPLSLSSFIDTAMSFEIPGIILKKLYSSNFCASVFIFFFNPSMEIL